MKLTPKYSLEALYVSPFTKRLSFDEKELKTVYVPLEKTRLRTGLEVVDMVVDKLVAYQDPANLPWQLGMKPAQMSTSLKVLTGLSLIEFRTRWRAKVAGELLRYTELPLVEVMRCCGYTSAQSFSRFIRNAYGMAPQHYRRQCRAQGDIGKYAL